MRATSDGAAKHVSLDCDLLVSLSSMMSTVARRSDFGRNDRRYSTVSHLGHTLKERMREPEMRYPCSPNRHCSPPTRLPPSPRTARVHRSTHPMLRLPPHTTLERQLRTAMFGASPPAGGWDGEKASKYGSFRPKSPQSP